MDMETHDALRTVTVKWTRLRARRFPGVSVSDLTQLLVVCPDETIKSTLGLVSDYFTIFIDYYFPFFL